MKSLRTFLLILAVIVVPGGLLFLLPVLARTFGQLRLRVASLRLPFPVPGFKASAKA